MRSRRTAAQGVRNGKIEYSAPPSRLQTAETVDYSLYQAKMARYYELSTDEQIWVMIRVKQGLMTMEDALEYVRSQHEQGGKASGDPRSPTGPGPGGGGERDGRDQDPLLGSPATQRRTRNSAPMRTHSQVTQISQRLT